MENNITNVTRCLSVTNQHMLRILQNIMGKLSEKRGVSYFIVAINLLKLQLHLKFPEFQ